MKEETLLAADRMARDRDLADRIRAAVEQFNRLAEEAALLGMRVDVARYDVETVGPKQVGSRPCLSVSVWAAV